jgi:hypothetical protein
MNIVKVSLCVAIGLSCTSALAQQNVWRYGVTSNVGITLGDYGLSREENYIEVPEGGFVDWLEFYQTIGVSAY